MQRLHLTLIGLTLLLPGIGALRVEAAAPALAGKTDCPYGASDCNRCAENVIDAMNRLRPRGDVMGFRMNDAADVSLFHHWQGIQRLNAGGGKYLAISRSVEDENVLFVIVELGSRDGDGKRFRSNRLSRTHNSNEVAPPPEDGVIWQVPRLEEFHHAGGMQALGNFLSVGVERATVRNSQTGEVISPGASKALIYDLSDPTSPRKLATEVDHTDLADAAGATMIGRLADGRILLGIGRGDSAIIDFYVSTGTDLATTGFVHFDTWSKGELHTEIGDDDFGDYQNVNLITQCDGTLFLVGTHENTLTGEDFADTFRLENGTGDEVVITKVASRHLVCNDLGGAQCNLDAAGGTYLDPDGQILLYGTEHDNDGPLGSVKFREFRPAPHSGCESLRDGWVELFADNHFGGRSLMIDYVDRDLRNYSAYDDAEDFGDVPSSAFYCLPEGVTYRLWQQTGCSGDHRDLVGHGIFESIADFHDFSFDDEVSCSEWMGGPLQVRQLTAADQDVGDKFGASVAVDGDTAVVGAWRDGGVNQSFGSAYVFVRNAGGGDNWGQVRKLTASDAALGDKFGVSVSISGDTIAIGTNPVGGNGKAYVFERNVGGGNNWGEVKKLTAADGAANDKFGLFVSISGDRVVVGAYGNDDAGSDSGSAYLFERNAGGPGGWGEVKKLTAADAATGDRFGGCVSVSGDKVAVGANGDDDAGSDSGSAYVFDRQAGGADNWGQVKKLVAPDGAAFDQFAGSVAISGSTVVAGASADNVFGNFAGSAHVFERSAGGADNWGHVKKLIASDAASFDVFGASVSIDGNRIVVGATGDDDVGGSSGSAYVFERSAGGADNWGEVKKLTAADAASLDTFGRSTSIRGDTVVIGADQDDAPVTDSGSAYVFDLSISSVCGDGFQEAPEACDDGAGNADGIPDACRTDCALPGCGDGVTDTGEDCDDTGESASCDADCTVAVCGDGAWNVSVGEICDDGNLAGGDSCAADCSVTDTGVPGGAAGGSLRLVSAAGSSIVLSFAPACSATDHAAYWGHGPIGTGGLEWSGSACGLGTNGTASFDPGTLLPGEWLYVVIVGYDGDDEGGYGEDSASTPRPEAVGIGLCDRPAGVSTCE